MSRQVEVMASPQLMFERACDLIAEWSPQTIALSGGSTPGPAYSLLRERNVIPDADVWTVDERCVPPASKDSNAKLIMETLQPQSFHRVRGEDPPEEAARVYDEEVRARLGDDPVFDVLVMGMGPDGHTASLFPGSPELDERERIAVATARRHEGLYRVTLTLPVINRARNILYIVRGADKAAPFHRIQDGELLPAGRVLGGVWLIDQAVATRPEPPPRKRKAWEPTEGQESLF